jgi:hypothetical protein
LPLDQPDDAIEEVDQGAPAAIRSRTSRSLASNASIRSGPLAVVTR